MEQYAGKRSFREFLAVVYTGHLLTALSPLVSIYIRNGTVGAGPLPGMIQPSVHEQ